MDPVIEYLESWNGRVMRAMRGNRRIPESIARDGLPKYT